MKDIFCYIVDMYHFTWHEIILCLVPYFITYLLFQGYKRNAVLVFQNRSRTLSPVPPVPVLMVDVSTTSYHFNLDLPNLLTLRMDIKNHTDCVSRFTAYDLRISHRNRTSLICGTTVGTPIQGFRGLYRLCR